MLYCGQSAMQTLRRSSAARPRCCTCPAVVRLRSFASSARSSAPPFVYTTLPSRALLAVQGPDAPNFLQGLVSNDVRRLAPRGDEDNPEKQRILYANILKADVSLGESVLDTRVASALIRCCSALDANPGPLHARHYAAPTLAR